MAYVPLGLVKSLAKSVIGNEGQDIIYRRPTVTPNTTTGSVTTVNSDTALKAVVGKRKARFVNGTLVHMKGEKVTIAALDLGYIPQAGDVVILAASETAAARRRVVDVSITGTQGSEIIYSVEVEP